MKKFFIFSLIFTGIVHLSAKDTRPEQLSVYGPIPVIKPLFIDSIDLKGNKYTDDNLLATTINFPEQEKFTTKITPDSYHYFRLQKPANGSVFYLVSFYVRSDRYGKAKLKITSPDRFELYVNDKKVTDKKSVEDSLSLAKSAETDLKGNINESRIVLKYLALSNAKVSPAFKVEIVNDKTDSTTVYTFDETGKHRLTIEDILIGKRASSTSISPSGRFVLMNFSLTNDEGKTSYSFEVFDTKLNKTILSENGYRNQLGWMPKSDLLKYFDDTDEGWSLFTLDPVTNRTSLSAKNLPKESFTFSPDEKTLYYSKKETLSAGSPKGLKRILAPDDRQDYYRDRYYIYQYQLDTGLSQQLTFGQNTASINDISNDGRYLLFSTHKEDLTERPFDTNDMYLLDLQSMKVDTLWTKEKFAGGAEFSPDSKQLLVVGGADAFGGIGKNLKSGIIANSYDTQAFIFDIATKKVDPITKDFNPTIDSDWWNKKDNCIYFRVEDKSYESIYKYTPKTRTYEKLPLKEELIQAFSLADNAPYASYVGSGTGNSRKIYLLDLKKMDSKLLADPYGERLSKIELGKVEDWTFTNKLGDVIDGRFYLPPGFDPSKKYPLIVYYYGGTSPTQRTFESTFPLQVYTAMDYVVYTLNPSGTTGYGQEFSSRHVNAWGDYTADEIIEGTKEFIASHPFVDGSKIACIGASYGGFMTQYLITKTDMFTAAISHAGISALSSYWGEGYWGYSYSSGASAGSYPWNNKKLYVDHSPLFNADKIKTPLLLLHGTADTNVPPGESIQMFTALKLLGKPVELVMVEGENHAIYDFQKRIEWNHTIYAWFAKWLKNDSSWWNDLYPNK